MPTPISLHHQIGACAMLWKTWGSSGSITFDIISGIFFVSLLFFGGLSYYRKSDKNTRSIFLGSTLTVFVFIPASVFTLGYFLTPLIPRLGETPVLLTIFLLGFIAPPVLVVVYSVHRATVAERRNAHSSADLKP